MRGFVPSSYAAEGKATAPVRSASTATYMAYANSHHGGTIRWRITYGSL